MKKSKNQEKSGNMFQNLSEVDIKILEIISTLNEEDIKKFVTILNLMISSLMKELDLYSKFNFSIYTSKVEGKITILVALRDNLERELYLRKAKREGKNKKTRTIMEMIKLLLSKLGIKID
ncbi:MAG: hypothetical protein KatS3mg096_605 [Candidatus Parcubacteria bacterium]|nr:MAG: hypothetical protein KatS3mg096_605 [Candidatus Parcubacteria bacterium]